MPPRQSPPPDSASIARLSERISETREITREQIERVADRLEQRFDRLEAKLSSKVDQLDADTQREFREARNDVGELRDRLAMVEEQVKSAQEAATEAGTKAEQAATASRAGTAAAVGAMRNTGELIAATPKATAQFNWKSFSGRFVQVCAAIAAAGAAVLALPPIARFLVKVAHALYELFVTNPVPPVPPGNMT